MQAGFINAHGLQLDVPPGWNAEIFQIGDGSPADGGRPRNLTPEERRASPPLLHAATVDLLPGRGTYATAMIDILKPRDAFVVLIDHGSEHANDPVFSMPETPWPLLPDHFDPSATPYMKSDVSFVQRFFHRQGRAFVLFAGIHEGSGRAAPVGSVNSLLAGLQIQRK